MHLHDSPSLSSIRGWSVLTQDRGRDCSNFQDEALGACVLPSFVINHNCIIVIMTIASESAHSLSYIRGVALAI